MRARVIETYEKNLSGISKNIHPKDDMYLKSVNGWSDYASVGRSTITLLDSILAKYQITPDNILDFGCGHGRIARHLRVALPDSSLVFSDIDEDAWRFCADEFNGSGFLSYEDFTRLEIPGSFSIIWLGSVFTHLDWEPSVSLLSRLLEHLKDQGVVIATLRGHACYEMMVNRPERFNMGGYYDSVLRDYERSGFGYMDYKGFQKWGQNLISPNKAEELAKVSGGRLMELRVKGWANIHDVAVWTRNDFGLQDR